MKKINIFLYYISDQPQKIPQKIPRVNLLLISVDVEIDYDDSDYESMVDENYDPADYEDYPGRKKQNITTVGLEILIDCSLAKTSINAKPTSVTAACMASPKTTSLPNIKKTAMASIKTQHE